MGGNAIKNAIRLNAKDYFKLSKEMTTRISNIFPDSRIRLLPAYKNKDSFGDMDLLVESNGLPEYWMDLVINEFKVNEFTDNGPTFSFGVNQFQIDLVFVPTHYYDNALSYYSWNDTGNFIGRIAKGMGFTFGHEGLSYKYYNDNHDLIKTIKISTDFDKSIDFLGFDVERHKKGFDNPLDIYQYIASSSFFRFESFLFENINHISRVRARKRPMYKGLLDYINTKDFPLVPRNKEFHLQRAFDLFENFERDCQESKYNADLQAAVKLKFNGDIVSELTGYKKHDLSALMKNIKNSFDTSLEFQLIIKNSNKDQINELITRFTR